MTFSQAISEKVTERALDIRQLVSMGWSEKDAIATVRKSSTLGPATSARVVAMASAATYGTQPGPTNPRLMSDSANPNGCNRYMVDHEYLSSEEISLE